MSLRLGWELLSPLLKPDWKDSKGLSCLGSGGFEQLVSSSVSIVVCPCPDHCDRSTSSRDRHFMYLAPCLKEGPLLGW